MPQTLLEKVTTAKPKQKLSLIEQILESEKALEQKAAHGGQPAAQQVLENIPQPVPLLSRVPFARQKTTPQPEAAPKGTEGPTITGISARKPTLLEQMGAMFAPTEFLTGRETRRTIYDPGYGSRGLIRPQEAMTPLEQEASPLAGAVTGAGQFIEGLTGPETVALIAGTAGFGSIPAIARGVIPKLVSTYFTAEMALAAYHQYPEFKEAVDRGDMVAAARIGTQLALTGAFAALAGRHAASTEPVRMGIPLADVKPGQVPTEPVVRGETMADFTAANLAAGRRARAVEAEAPKSTAPPPILKPGAPGPQPGTPEALALGAQRVREARQYADQLRDELAQGIEQRLRNEGLLEPEQTIQVVDKRAVKPEDVAPETPAPARMKLMITKADEAALRSRGFTQQQIDRMKPADAGEILARTVPGRPAPHAAEPLGKALPEPPEKVVAQGARDELMRRGYTQEEISRMGQEQVRQALEPPAVAPTPAQPAAAEVPKPVCRGC